MRAALGCDPITRPEASSFAKASELLETEHGRAVQPIERHERAVRAHELLQQAMRLVDAAHLELREAVGSGHVASRVTVDAATAISKAKTVAFQVRGATRNALTR